MKRTALFAALLCTACVTATPYGTVAKPHPMLVEYGHGKPGCWAERGQAESLASWAAMAVPECRAWALEHGHRVLVSVGTAEGMEAARVYWGYEFRELRGYAQPRRDFYGWHVVLSELAFTDGTWRALLEHELRHVVGDQHGAGEDFEK